MKESRWAATQFSELHLLRFGDDFVVFDTGSGGTHEVDPIAAHVLECIAMQSLSPAELKESILEKFDFLVDSDLDTYLDSLFHTLNRKQLVRPIDA